MLFDKWNEKESQKEEQRKSIIVKKIIKVAGNFSLILKIYKKKLFILDLQNDLKIFNHIKEIMNIRDKKRNIRNILYIGKKNQKIEDRRQEPSLNFMLLNFTFSSAIE